jgi:hypothetical protein
MLSTLFLRLLLLVCGQGRGILMVKVMTILCLLFGILCVVLQVLGVLVSKSAS